MCVAGDNMMMRDVGDAADQPVTSTSSGSGDLLPGGKKDKQVESTEKAPCDKH